MRYKLIPFIVVVSVSLFVVFVSLLLVYLHTQTERLVAKYQPLTGAPPVELPHKMVGNICQTEIDELSGLTYHPQRKTLFVVADEGSLYEMHTDGRLARSEQLKQADFEGITVNPQTGLLYAVIEGADNIVELTPETFQINRTFDVNRNFEGRQLLKKGGMGLEGIVFIQNPFHPEGGTFWIGNQSFTLKPNQEPSIICEVVLPLVSSKARKAEARIIRFFPMNVIDISGLAYDAWRDCIIVMSDTTNLLLEVKPNGQIIHQYFLPGSDQEGIVLDQKGFMYIAQEIGGVIKIDDRRVR